MMPGVAPWQWGLCDHPPTEWLGYVLTADGVENDTDVRVEMTKRYEQNQARINKRLGRK